jgi:hypothetical protein
MSLRYARCVSFFSAQQPAMVLNLVNAKIILYVKVLSASFSHL